MMKRFFACAAALSAAVLVAQPALAVTWKLVGSSGNAHSSNPANPSMAVVGADDENLYEIDPTDGSYTYIRGLRNNVDAILAAPPPAGVSWTGPFWGESYRDGQHVEYNPDDGLLYHLNGTTGYRDAPDPRHYDTRLIEAYDPGDNGAFSAAPVSIANSLTTYVGGILLDPVGRVNPDFPLSGDYGGSRDFTWDPVDSYWILTDKDGHMGHTVSATDWTSTTVRTNALSHKGVGWYQDGVGGHRLFGGVNDESPGDQFYELDADSSSGDFLAPLALSAAIVVSGTAGVVEQSIAMDQHPVTGDLYAIVVLDIGGRHLIRYPKATIDAFNPLTDLFITAEYIGETLDEMNSLAHIPVADELVGDGNGDGWVDGLDYLTWASNFGEDPSDPPGPAGGDYNGDGKTDGLDYLAWASNFGSHSSASAVPEPSTFALAGLALASLLAARRRK